MSVPDTVGGDVGRGHRGASALAVVLTVLTVAVLLWPDGWVVNRGVVRVYVFFLERGMPQRVTPEDYAVLLNVAVFVPLGWIGVAMLRWPPAGVAWSLTAASAAVELVQALPAFGRDPSLLATSAVTTSAGEPTSSATRWVTSWRVPPSTSDSQIAAPAPASTNGGPSGSGAA